MIKESMSSILEKASKIRKKEDKIAFLRQHYTKEMHHVLAFGYDPRIEWLLPLDKDDPTSNPPYKELDSDSAASRLYQESRRLYIFVKNGSPNLNQARREHLFIQFLESIDANDAKMMLRIARKQPPFKGITQELIEEAYGVYNG